MVCEGPCNPTVNELDGLVRASARSENRKTGTLVKCVSNLPDATVARLRELKHTPHEESYREPMEPQMFACIVCGHRRAFGL